MKTYTKFILRSTVNGVQVYLGKGGATVPRHEQAVRFSREQVKQMAESVQGNLPFMVTPVAR
jgi:hypothetical protein